MAEEQGKKPGKPAEPEKKEEAAKPPESKEQTEEEIDAALGGWKPVRIVPGDKETSGKKEAGEPKEKEKKPAQAPKAEGMGSVGGEDKPKLKLRDEKPMRVEPAGPDITAPPPPAAPPAAGPPPAAPPPPAASPPSTPQAEAGGDLGLVGDGPMRIEPAAAPPVAGNG